MLRGLIGVAVDRKVQHVERNERWLRRRPMDGITQPGIDMQRCFLAVTHACGHRPVARHHVAARKDARVTRHHGRGDLHGAVSVIRYARDFPGATALGLLAQRENYSISGERFELASCAWPAIRVDLHLLDGQRRTDDLLDACQPFDPHALFDGLVGLESVRRHVLTIASVHNQCIRSAEALRGTGCVHRGVTAAVDDNPPSELRAFARPDATQVAHGVNDASCVSRRDVDMLRGMRADRQKYGLEAVRFLLHEKVLDLVIENEFHAHGLDLAYFLHQVFARKSVRGYAEVQHPAGDRTSIKVFDLLLETRVIYNCCETSQSYVIHTY